MNSDQTEVIDNFSRSNALAMQRVFVGLFKPLEKKGILSKMEIKELLDEQRKFLFDRHCTTDFQLAAPAVIDHILGEIMR